MLDERGGMGVNECTRTVLQDGSVRLATKAGSFTFTRVRPGVISVSIVGHDTGAFGAATLDEITAFLNRERPITLFVDTRAAKSVAPAVRTDWTHFFSSNRTNLRAVHVLTHSKAVHLSVAVAQHFSNTGNLSQLYSNSTIFESKLADAASR